MTNAERKRVAGSHHVRLAERGISRFGAVEFKTDWELLPSCKPQQSRASPQCDFAGIFRPWSLPADGPGWKKTRPSTVRTTTSLSAREALPARPTCLAHCHLAFWHPSRTRASSPLWSLSVDEWR